MWCCSCAVVGEPLDQSEPRKIEAGGGPPPSPRALGIWEDHVETRLRGFRLLARNLPVCGVSGVQPTDHKYLLQTWPLLNTMYVCLGVWACPVSPQGAFAVAGLSGKLLDQDLSAWHWQLVPCCSLWAAVPFIVTNPVMCPGLQAPRLTLYHPWQGVGPVSLFPSVYFLFARRYPRAPFSALQLSTPGLQIL